MSIELGKSNYTTLRNQIWYMYIRFKLFFYSVLNVFEIYKLASKRISFLFFFNFIIMYRNECTYLKCLKGQKKKNNIKFF